MSAAQAFNLCLKRLDELKRALKALAESFILCALLSQERVERGRERFSDGLLTIAKRFAHALILRLFGLALSLCYAVKRAESLLKAVCVFLVA